MRQNRPLPQDLVIDAKKMDEAMALAAQDAFRLHHQAGLPIVAWRNGQVVWIPPEELGSAGEVPKQGSE